MLLYTLLLAGAALTSGQYTKEALGDEITNLPGLTTNINFRQFSGYVNLGGRAIFYWFVESESDPSKAPVTLWTNGGPGCSGMSGFLTEQGPFRVNQAGKLNLFEHRWNQISNMIFVEQPVGVGYSWTDKEMEYGDDMAAEDNMNFLLGWLEKFPQYMSNDLYISSESYGGHYMPTLSQKLVERRLPNFRGMIVGNPLTWMPYRDYGMWGTFAGHQMIPRPEWDQYMGLKCNVTNSLRCNALEIKFNGYTSNIDPYALDFPICADEASKTGRHERFLMRENVRRAKAARSGMLKDYFPSDYEPCISEWVSDYLNRPDVKTALHFDDTHPVTWTECDGSINSNWNQTDLNAPMMPVYQWLMNNSDIKILIYSGDNDSVCATLGTQQFIWNMSPINSAWKPWLFSNGQMGGYLVKFDEMSFATVHGAGHMVPATRPLQAFEVFKAYLNGTLTVRQ